MPHAIGLDRKHRRRGLQVILVHCQDDPDLARFMYAKFPANEAMVTADNPVPFPTGTRLRLPRCALVGVDGTYLIDGLRAEVGADVDRMIEEQLARRAKGWGASEELRRARALLHGEGELAAAKALLDGLQPRDPEETADLAAARRELEVVYEARRTSIEHFRKAGDLHRAHDLARATAAAVAGVALWEVQMAEAVAAFAGPEAKKDLRLAAKVDKVMESVRARGVKKGVADRLRKLVRDAKGSAVWARALRTAAVFDRVTD